MAAARSEFVALKPRLKLEVDPPDEAIAARTDVYALDGFGAARLRKIALAAPERLVDAMLPKFSAAYAENARYSPLF